MANKPTVSQLKQKVEELLTIAPVAERYGELEKQIKADMLALKWENVEVAGKGRVFISSSTQRSFPVELVEKILGTDLAAKIVQIKKSVSNKLLDAFVEAGEISADKAQELEAGAEKTAKVSLYVRPLK